MKSLRIFAPLSLILFNPLLFLKAEPKAVEEPLPLKALSHQIPSSLILS